MSDREERRRVTAEYMKRPHSRLMSASERGSVKAAKEAVDEGALINEHEPSYGDTALHAAAGGVSIKVSEYLVESGAALDALNNDMMTPLMCACSTGKKNGSKVALFLLEKGANACYVRQDDGMDAMKFALWGRCTDEVIKKLEALGAARPNPDFKIIHID